MPIAIKLSRRFYDQFGEETANELVGLINVVDDRYRSDMLEANERNFVRYDARLEQRLADLRSDLRTEMGHLRTDMADLRTEMADRSARLEATMYREMRSQTRWLVGSADIARVAGLLASRFMFESDFR